MRSPCPGRFLWCPLAALTVSSAALAQAQPPSAPVAIWTASAGLEQVSLRDVARSGPPVDASPVAREGSGPLVTIEYRRVRHDRLHRFEFSGMTAGDFSYVSVRGESPLPASDDATSVGGRYEYRRYPWRDLGFRGFDAGVGLEALADRLSITRAFPPAITIADTILRGGAGIVAAVRLRRWPRLDVEAAWTNAALLATAAQSHNAATTPAGRRLSPGWLTDLDLATTVHATDRFRAIAAYRGSGEGLFGTRPAWAFSRHRFSIGIAYVY